LSVDEDLEEWHEHSESLFFPDPAAARRAAAVLRTLAPPGDDDDDDDDDDPAMASEPFMALVTILRDSADIASVDGVTIDGATLVVAVSLHRTIDDHDEMPRSEAILGALVASARVLGGVPRHEHVELELARRREAQQASARQLGQTGEELLRALDAVQGDLLRFERVCVESLRTSVRAGSVLDGQRLEAARILARVSAARVGGS
jgi:hypothetical protein